MSSDPQYEPDSVVQSEEYSKDKTLIFPNLRSRTYTATVKILDDSDKILASRMSRSFKIQDGEQTILNVSVTGNANKTGCELTIEVKRSVTEKTVPSLVGTEWSQPNASGYFAIAERTISGPDSDGCNSFIGMEFFFAAAGTILQNEDSSFAISTAACGTIDGKKNKQTPLSSYPFDTDHWTAYILKDGQLIITTATGKTHAFTRVNLQSLSK